MVKFVTWRTLLVGFILLVIVFAADGPEIIRWIKQLPNGQIRNHSSQTLWVIVSNHGSHAYLLRPGRKSPDSLDADAVRSTIDKPIQQDTTWFRIRDGSSADVWDMKKDLRIDCRGIGYFDNHTFFNVRYHKPANWGSPL